jgi:hypothetical protein
MELLVSWEISTSIEKNKGVQRNLPVPTWFLFADHAGTIESTMNTVSFVLSR